MNIHFSVDNRDKNPIFAGELKRVRKALQIKGKMKL
jgi:hypothetical protein